MSLYALRTFAEFRRQFYVALVTSGGARTVNRATCSFSNQLQSIRNTELNLKSTKRNLEIYEEEAQGRHSIRSSSVISWRSTYQQTQSSLLSQQAGLQTSLDAFKINLGLPTELEVRLDDSVLDQFELNDERLDKMRDRIEALLLKLLQNDVLPRSDLADAARQLQAELAELEQVHDQAVGELGRWRAKLEATEKGRLLRPRRRPQQGDLRAGTDACRRRSATSSTETDQHRSTIKTSWRRFLAKLDAMPLAEATKSLRNLVEQGVPVPALRGLRGADPDSRLLDRASARGPDGQPGDPGRARQSAGSCRTPWRTVTDAWRKVEVDANALQGILNFQYNGSFNEAPNHAGLFRFDAANSIQTFGLQFQAPINRRAAAQSIPRRPDPVPAGPPCLHARPRHRRPANSPGHASARAAAPHLRDQPRADHHRLAPARAGRV